MPARVIYNCALSGVFVRSSIPWLSDRITLFRKEQITDEDVDSWRPALEREAVFA